MVFAVKGTLDNPDAEIMDLPRQRTMRGIRTVAVGTAAFVLDSEPGSMGTVSAGGIGGGLD